MDDIKKDDEIRDYQWQMQLPDDLRILNYKARNLTAADLVLGDIAPGKNTRFRDDDSRSMAKGHPLLLVRVLQAENDPSLAPHELRTIQAFAIEQRTQGDKILDVDGRASRGPDLHKTLVLNTRAKAGDFKVLLIPFRHGEDLPKVKLLSSGSFELEWKAQKDVVSFGAIGERSNVSIDRNGSHWVKSY
jgi:hypothetical protein